MQCRVGNLGFIWPGAKGRIEMVNLASDGSIPDPKDVVTLAYIEPYYDTGRAVPPEESQFRLFCIWFLQGEARADITDETGASKERADITDETGASKDKDDPSWSEITDQLIRYASLQFGVWWGIRRAVRKAGGPPWAVRLGGRLAILIAAPQSQKAAKLVGLLTAKLRDGS
jgi:hypothetical protein